MREEIREIYGLRHFVSSRCMAIMIQLATIIMTKLRLKSSLNAWDSSNLPFVQISMGSFSPKSIFLASIAILFFHAVE